MKLSNKKKILFAITRSHWGGAQRYVYDLATSLSANQFDVSVVAGGSGPLITKLQHAGIQVFPLHTTRNVNPLEELRTFVSLFMLFRKEKPDIVHLNSSKIGGVGAVAARFARVPKIVFTAHGWGFHENRSPVQKALIQFFSWASTLFHHTIICVSDYDARSARTLPFAERKVVTIKNAIKEADFLSKQRARKHIKETFALSIPTRAVWMGTIAELTKNKGIIHAIRAAAKLPLKNWVFIVMGEGEERKALEAEIRRHNLQNNIFLVGHVPNAHRYLKAFDIFTLTSLKEGFPYALLEAGSAKLPVVASDVGGISEIIHGGKTGLLTAPGNENAIHHAIYQLAKNKDVRNYFAENLHKKIGDEFSFHTMQEQTCAAYSSFK